MKKRCWISSSDGVGEVEDPDKCVALVTLQRFLIRYREKRIQSSQAQWNNDGGQVALQFTSHLSFSHSIYAFEEELDIRYQRMTAISPRDNGKIMERWTETIHSVSVEFLFDSLIYLLTDSLIHSFSHQLKESDLLLSYHAVMWDWQLEKSIFNPHQRNTEILF